VIHSTLSESITATQIPAIIHHAIPKGQILQTGPGQQPPSPACLNVKQRYTVSHA